MRHFGWFSNTVSVLKGSWLPFESKITLEIVHLAKAIFHRNQTFVIASIVTIGLDHSSLVNFFSAKQAISMLSFGIVIRRPTFVIFNRTFTFKNTFQIDGNDDPIDALDTMFGAKDGKGCRVFSRFRQKT